MDEEEKAGNFVGRLCAGFRLACGCIPRQKTRSATSGNINFLNYGKLKKNYNKFRKIGEITKMFRSYCIPFFLHIKLHFLLEILSFEVQRLTTVPYPRPATEGL